MKGKYIEISQTKLSDQLSVLWGEPEIIKPPEMEKTLDGRDGVASFFDIPGYQVGDRLGGHIDVIDGTKWSLLNWNWLRARSYQCGSGCYFDSGKIWFWELT